MFYIYTSVTEREYNTLLMKKLCSFIIIDLECCSSIKIFLSIVLVLVFDLTFKDSKVLLLARKFL